MFYPGDAKETARRLVSEWLEDPAGNVDPLQGAARFCREGAKHYASMDATQHASSFVYLADLLDAVVREVRAINLDYDSGAALSVWGRGTLRNKKKDFEKAPRGRVPLGDLPLKPTEKNAGVHAHRAIQLMTEQKSEQLGTDRRRAAQADDDEAWADEQLRSMTA